MEHINDTVEFYQKLILETLYKGFINKPPNRINNIDVDNVFINIQDNSNFNIAIELLCQDNFLEGKDVVFGNPPFLQITGEGLVYYEKTYIIPSEKREYTLLVSKLLRFLRDLGNSKYDLSKYIVDSSNTRVMKVEIPFSDINDIIKNDYNYELDNLKWSKLYFTSDFVNKHIMGINGIGLGNKSLSFHNPNSFCLNGNGYKFLTEVFFFEKFHKIENKDGRNRVIQLYDDLSSWIIQNRWVDVAINMGAIIEYCIDYYVEVNNLQEFFKKGNLIENFSEKLRIVLQNPQLSSNDIYNQQHRATWKRIQSVLKDYRNYIHISKLVKERSPLDKKSIKNVYTDFQSILNILLNL
ncbi:MAG: hypothetical protein CEE43_02180 [Promethearchaeota archaeon Loki_b32]|nr:MAG: hypothetical protein CEE43_02180 [Candidatus Lokiarchaeota archaeon Loki_b32]